MKTTPNYLALLLAVMTFPLTAAGKDDQAPNDEAIDDIVVVGEKSLADLRRDVYKAEEEFYSVFNRLNDEKDFTVRCFYETATGTHQKNHVCRARYVSQAFAKHAARNRNDISRVANQDADPAFAEKTARYQAKMESLMAESPELQAAFMRYNEARTQFFAEREDVASN